MGKATLRARPVRRGRKETRNKYSAASLGAAWATGTGRVRAGDWNWTAVRPERYIFLNILVTVRNRLVTQPCHLLPAIPITYLLLTRYVPGHRRGYAKRVSGFLVTRCGSLSLSFSLSLFSSSSFVTIRCVGNYGAQHASSLFAGRSERVRAFRVYIAVSRDSTFTRELLLVETLRLRREM